MAWINTEKTFKFEHNYFEKRVELKTSMMCLNFRALFSQNVSMPIQVQNQRSCQFGLIDFFAEKKTFLFSFLLLFHIILWREIQTQHE